MPPLPCQCILEELVDQPRNSRRRNLKDDAGGRAGEKPGETAQLIDRSCRGQDAVDLFAVLRHGALFLCVQQRLADIKWSCQSRSDGSGKCPGEHVRHRPILTVVVNEVLCELVDDKVKALIRYVKQQLRAKTVVESLPAFLSENLASTVER